MLFLCICHSVLYKDIFLYRQSFQITFIGSSKDLLHNQLKEVPWSFLKDLSSPQLTESLFCTASQQSVLQQILVIRSALLQQSAHLMSFRIVFLSAFYVFYFLIFLTTEDTEFHGGKTVFFIRVTPCNSVVNNLLPN